MRTSSRAGASCNDQVDVAAMTETDERPGSDTSLDEPTREASRARRDLSVRVAPRTEDDSDVVGTRRDDLVEARDDRLIYK